MSVNSDIPYLFKLIVLATDDEQLYTLRSDTMVMGHVGEIIAKVSRRTEVKVVGLKIVQENLLEHRPSNVHEKALKGQAKSHSISYVSFAPSPIKLSNLDSDSEMDAHLPSLEKLRLIS